MRNIFTRLMLEAADIGTDDLDHNDYDCYPTLSAETLSNAIYIGNMRVPEQERGQGLGTAAMKKLLDTADRQGRYVLLQVYPYESQVVDEITSDGRGLTYDKARTRLAGWYQNMGFVKANSGDTDWMYRPPQLIESENTNTTARIVHIGTVDYQDHLSVRVVDVAKYYQDNDEMPTHVGLGLFGGDRWRFPESSNTVFWWGDIDDVKTDIRDATKIVDQYLARKGYRNLRHRTMIDGSLEDDVSAGRMGIQATKYGSGVLSKSKSKVHRSFIANETVRRLLRTNADDG